MPGQGSLDKTAKKTHFRTSAFRPYQVCVNCDADLFQLLRFGLTIFRSGRISLSSNVNEFKNVVKFNIAGVVKINNVVRFNLGVTSFRRRACGPINCFDDKSNLTLLKIY